MINTKEEDEVETTLYVTFNTNIYLILFTRNVRKHTYIYDTGFVAVYVVSALFTCDSLTYSLA